MQGIIRPALLVLAALTVLSAKPADAQTSPASGPFPVEAVQGANDAVALADYLKLLGQIAPAAEEGARTYLAAVQLRCGYTPSSNELRHAMSQGSGNPVLMGLIGAAYQQDTIARAHLIGQIQCGASQ